MGEPLFSIVLPTYNRAHMLPGALSTVLRQTCGDYEVLIVDDGSMDETPEMIKEWTKDKRFKYTRVPKNIGNMACRNMALEMAAGTWVTNIDSDDFWTLDRLEKFSEFFKNWTGTRILHSFFMSGLATNTTLRPRRRCAT